MTPTEASRDCLPRCRFKQRWLNLGLGAKGALVLAIPLVMLLVLTAVFLLLSGAVGRTHRAVVRSAQVDQGVRQVLTLALEAETGVRGYLLTGNPAYRRPYQVAVTQLPAALSQLGGLAKGGNLEERLVLDRVVPEVHADLAVLGALSNMPIRSPMPAAEARLVAQDKASMDRIRLQLQMLSADDATLAAAGQANAAAASRHLRNVTLATALVGLVGGLFAIWAFTHGLARRVGAIEANADLLAMGTELEPIEPAGDEIGRLSDALFRASSLLAAREATLLALFATSPDPILMLSADHRVLFASHALEAVVGHSPGEWEGRRLVDMVHPQDLERLEHELGMMGRRPADRMSVTARFAHANGSWIVADLHGQTMAPQHGNKEGTVVVMRDFTQRHQLEEGLRAAKAAAEEANRAKSDFLSRMSHELRTPLNAVLGFAQLLELDSPGPAQLESIHQIVRGGRHLLDLINEVLDISRIEAGRMPLSPEPVEVFGVIVEVVDLVRPLAEAAGVVITARDCEVDTRVIADRQRLKQVLLNLAANAIKYNHRGGSVVIGMKKMPNGGVRTEVVDTGRGIPPEKFDDIFTPFERLGAERSGIEGTGVGLALSRKLVEMMEGKLRVESAVGEGSTFSVELPLARSIAAPLPAARFARGGAPPELVAARTRGTLLYIEDNPPNVHLVEKVLEQRPGIELVVAGHGRLALELARAQSPSLIVLDLHLPDMSGEEILRALRSNPETSKVPIAVLSADATPRQVARMTRAGAIEYMTKPLDVAAFLALIDRVIGGGERSRREHRDRVTG